MRILKRTLLILVILIFLSLVSVCGVLLYLYHHPSDIKPFIEKSISQTTGIRCTIDHLSYNLDPLTFEVRGLTLTPRDEFKGFRLTIPGLQADMALEGPFGRKTLVLKKLKMDGPALEVDQQAALPEVSLPKSGDTPLSRAGKAAIAFFLFKDIRLVRTELSGAKMTVRLADTTIQLQEIRAGLDADRLLTISCMGRIARREMQFDIPDLRFVTGQALSLTDPEITGRFTAHHIRFQGPEAAAWALNVEADLHYSHNRRHLAFSRLSLHGDGLRVSHDSEAIPLPFGLDLRAEGRLDLRGSALAVPSLHLTLGNTVDLKGALQGGVGPKPGIDLNIHQGRLVPQDILSLLPGRMKKALPPVILSGALSLQGTVSATEEKQGWAVRSNLLTQLKQNKMSFVFGDRHLQGTLSGKIQTKGLFPDLRFDAALTGEEILLTGGDIALRPFQADLVLSGQYPLFHINNFNARLPSLETTIGHKVVRIDNIHLEIPEGAMDIKERRFNLDRARIDSSLLKNLLVSFRVQGDEIKADIRGEDMNLIESARTLDLLPPGWRLQGEDVLFLSATRKGEGAILFSTKLGLQGLSLQNPDGTLMGEKLSFSMETEGTLDPDGPMIAAAPLIRMHGGEMLVDRFYFDFTKNSFTSRGNARFDPGKKALTISRLDIGLKDIFSLKMEGQVTHIGRSPEMKLSLNLTETPVLPLFSAFVLDPFKTETPLLAKIKPSGDLSADLEIEGTIQAWDLKGRCGWRRGRLSAEAPDLDFEGINLDMPVWIRSTKRASEGPPIGGTFTLGNMRLSEIINQPLAFPLEARPNRLSIPSDILLRLPGGTVRVSPIECRDILTPERSVDTALELDIEEPDTLFAGLLPIPIQGTVEGRLAPLRIKGDVLDTKGGIRAHLFGGDILFSDIGGRGLLTPAPVFHLSARWDDLNLSDLTTNTSFGKVEGILKGHVLGLELAQGQPQKFDLLLETVKTKGVPQNISVKAVDNIAQIGGGQSPFVGAAGIFSSFFKNFSYKKIGIKASLENDVFRVNGTVREGQTEYFIKRGGFSGVNIINKDPDNRIRFKDMVKRIKGVLSSKRAPAVR